MKYRVTLDMFFDSEKDKDALIAVVKPFVGKAVSIKTGGVSPESSRATWHLCGHDEGKPCEPMQNI